MLDIKLIRENPELVKENIKKKFQNEKLKIVDDILNEDKEYLKVLKEEQEIRTKRNRISDEINKLKKEGKDIKTKLKEAKKIPEELAKAEEKKKKILEGIREKLLLIPNIIHESVPIGEGAAENAEREKIGKPRAFDFEVKSHGELIEGLNVIDFDAARRVAGKGFFYLKGGLAMLNQALIRFGIDFMVKKGYRLVEPPLMINKATTAGTTDVNFIREMIYKIEGEDLYLIGTSEHPLIGMFCGELINENELPIKLCGYSQCFRKEVGSHGIDERGLYRTHQFNKVEQIVICKPGESYKLYDELLNNSKELFKALEIPTRIVECCSGDLADLKAKSADLEAWSPRKKEYFEVCSCSNLTDAQARRLDIKVRKGNDKYYPHTLNNTAIATSRVMVAIIENFQNKDGSIDVPKALWPYMDGMKKIVKEKRY